MVHSLFMTSLEVDVRAARKLQDTPVVPLRCDRFPPRPSWARNIQKPTAPVQINPPWQRSASLTWLWQKSNSLWSLICLLGCELISHRVIQQKLQHFWPETASRASQHKNPNSLRICEHNPVILQDKNWIPSHKHPSTYRPLLGMCVASSLLWKIFPG